MNHALLNNVEHKNLKVKQDYSIGFGNDQMCVPVYPAELRHAQGEYPIVFAKDAEGNMQLVALLGLEKGENLYLNGKDWLASYKPLLVEKGPFLIGRNANANDNTLSIHVDLDDPRIVDSADDVSDSDNVFLPHGGNSDYIDNIANVLSTIHAGQGENNTLVDACNAHGLIESFVLDINLGGSNAARLSGFYTINEEKFNALSKEDIASLFEQGQLQAIYMVLASMAQIRRVIEFKKRKITQ